jgi:hypothetical protein
MYHMSDGAPPFRPQLAPDEPDQVLRLAAYRVAYPVVVIQPGQFATWEARIPEPAGETAIVRHTLRDLLDRLGELLGEPSWH